MSASRRTRANGRTGFLKKELSIKEKNNMKNYKKIPLILVLLFTFVFAVGTAGCDLSNINQGFDGYYSGFGRHGDEEHGESGDTGEHGDTGDEGGAESGETGDTGSGETGAETGEQGETGEPVQSNFPDYVRFYGYQNAFDNAQSTFRLSITSLDMLTAYIDYVNFYGITNHVNITLNYSATDFITEYNKAADEYASGDRLILDQSFRIEYLGRTGKYYVTESNTFATDTIDQDKEYVSGQVDYALKMVLQEDRADDYDSFKINYVEKAIGNITNTEQLYWTIQNGYKPLCVSGSTAEVVYEMAKSVLREIVTDDMDDVTKLRAIYEWLALNVQYDNYAYQISTETVDFYARQYDSWFAEGVFNNRKAVCEGYAKSLIILAGIEGIPAIRVTGNGHAWNRVQIDGKWYVVDSTHADVHVSDNEVFSYAQFMITDEQKAYLGYSSDDFSELTATEEFNVFTVVTFTYGDNEYDLVIDSKAELKSLLLYGRTNKTFGEDLTVDFYVFSDKVSDYDDWKNDLDVILYYKSSLTPSFDAQGNGHYFGDTCRPECPYGCCATREQDVGNR